MAFWRLSGILKARGQKGIYKYIWPASQTRPQHVLRYLRHSANPTRTAQPKHRTENERVEAEIRPVQKLRKKLKETHATKEDAKSNFYAVGTKAVGGWDDLFVLDQYKDKAILVDVGESTKDNDMERFLRDNVIVNPSKAAEKMVARDENKFAVADVEVVSLNGFYDDCMLLQEASRMNASPTSRACRATEAPLADASIPANSERSSGV